MINDKTINDSRSISTKFNDFFGSKANTINMKKPKSQTNYKTIFKTCKCKSTIKYNIINNVTLHM